MEQNNETQSGGLAPDSDKAVTRSTAEMQEDNATGANENEQGQAAFITGATTGGGSNFGQGSSHLGSESYRQGGTAGAGSNYDNEAQGLGSSAIGTSNEAASTPTSGPTGSSAGAGDRDRPGNSSDDETSMKGNTSARGTGRPPSGSWSQSSTEGG